MKTLSDLKRRLKIGTTLTLIDSSNCSHKYLNIPRKIVDITSKGFYLDSNGAKSYFEYPKATKIIINPDGFRCIDEPQLEYRIENEN